MRVYFGSILTISAKPVIPMYLRLCDSLLRKREIVVVAESKRDCDGKIIHMVLRHWKTMA